MKKFFRVLLLTGVLAAVLCVCALAADATTENGIYDLQVADSYQSAVTIGVTGTASTVTIDSKEYQDFYAGADQVSVSYTGAASGSYYLLYALKDNEKVPSVSNLVYIDQATADSTGTVSFKVYPASLTAGITYYVYMSSNNDATLGSSAVQVASFKYYTAYTRGDVDGNNEIDVRDAAAILKYLVDDLSADDTFIDKAADVNEDGEIDVRDCSLILQYIVGAVDDNFEEIT